MGLPEFVTVGPAEAFAEGRGHFVEVAGRHVALFRLDGEFHAIDNLCLHRAGPLCDGPLRGTFVTCPWHGWAYDVRTGTLVQDPRVGVSRHVTRVVDGHVQVQLTD
jgi:nitrite reductase (NADH) small subunit